MPKQSSGKKSQPRQVKGKAITPPASQRSAQGKATTAPAVQRPAARAETVPASAAQRREQQRQATTQRPQQQRNRRKVQRKSNTGMWVTLGVVVVAILVVVGIFIYLGTRPSSGTTANGYPSTPADSTVVNEITSVSSSVLAAVGTGPSGKVTKPTKLSFTTLLTGSGGKPEVFYQGGEYCPYCAAERWAMIVALSRFGTFHNLSQISSSSTDVYANTPTFSFYHSSYTSQYIDFVPLEEESFQGTTLQTPSAEQQQIISSLNPGGSFPFIDIANKYSVTGASYDPQVLANLDWQSVASTLSNPSNPVAQSILGTANYLTATICEATNQQPASVCTAAPIPSVEAALNGSTGSSGSSLGFAISAPVAAIRRIEG